MIAAGGRYRAADVAMLRVSGLAADGLVAALDACPAGDAGWAERYHGFLAETWRLPQVSAAITVAAPDLAAAVAGLPAATERDRRRALRGLGRYINRMSIRPTPLGLVAGVGGASFGPKPGAVLGAPVIGRPMVRPDMRWVTRLRGRAGWDDGDGGDAVRVNDLVCVSGGHVWLDLPRRRPASLPLSAPVAAVLREAAKPISRRALLRTLAAGSPGAAEADIQALLERLWNLGVLVAGDRPPPTAGPRRPLTSLVGGIPPGLPGEALDRADRLLAEANEPGGTVPDLTAEAGRLTPGYRGPLLHIDAALRFAGTPTLDPAVQRLAEQAAQVLERLGRGNRYPAHLREYAEAFVERYGMAAEVPVLELLSDGPGLGPPTGYRFPERRYPLARRHPEPPAPDPREPLLAFAVADALARRSIEFRLDDPRFAALAQAGSDTDDTRPRLPGADICLRTATREGGGLWGVLTGPMAAAAGAVSGRFDDLMDERTRRRLKAAVRAEEAVATGHLFAEILYTPVSSAAANVGTKAEHRGWQIAVNLAPTVPDDRVIALADVLVGVERGRLYLRGAGAGAAAGRRLHVTQASMLIFDLAPNPVRLLLEVSANQFRHVAPFEWGTAGQGPFQPRLTRGNVVVAPARWHCPGPDASRVEGFAHWLDGWAAAWMVPRYVHLVEESTHLLLDLRSGPSQAELQAALERGPVILEEALPVPGQGDLRDAAGHPYEHEIVVPVLRESGPATPGTSPRARAVPVVRAADRLRPPGSDWLSADLYADSVTQDRLLIGHFPRLRARLRDAHSIERFFFTRYSDPAPHLRLRVHVGSAARTGAVVDEVLDWAHSLAADVPLSDLSFRTYRREVERYGGPGLIEIAEDLFCADSAAVLDVLPALRGLPLTRAGAAALTLEGIAGVLVPGLRARRDLALLISERHIGGPEYRTEAGALWAAKTGPGPASRLLRTVHDRWRAPGAAYALALAGLAPGDGPVTRSDIAITSLLHMHTNRLGLRRAGEAVALGLWRRLLDRLVHEDTQRDGSRARERHSA